MVYSSQELVLMTGASRSIISTNGQVMYVATDSRLIHRPSWTVFFAMPGQMTHGIHFVKQAYDAGVRHFVVPQDTPVDVIEGANYYFVDDSLAALQRMAKKHLRAHHQIKIIGITGSNGKTIVKEWLYQALYDRWNIVKSPKSYNSLLGVPLSILLIDDDHELGLIEVGISKPEEMDIHREMVAPQIGIFTNLGSAHDEGYRSREQKLMEKLKLFEDAQAIIFCEDHDFSAQKIRDLFRDKTLFSWGKNGTLRVFVEAEINGEKKINLSYKGEDFTLTTSMTDEASVQNMLHCISTMLYLGLSPNEVVRRVMRLRPLEMRLAMKDGIAGSLLIDDTYSADIEGLRVAIDFMNRHAGDREKVLVVSPFEQSGMSPNQVLNHIVSLALQNDIGKIIYIAESPVEYAKEWPDEIISFVEDKMDVIDQFEKLDLREKAILFKGSRKSHFEDLVAAFSLQAHDCTMTVSLSALENNVRVYKSLLRPGTGIIAIVKASAYGSGPYQVAELLHKSGITQMAVALVDEGVKLRTKGIDLPIMVLNPSLSSLSTAVRYGLDIEVFSLNQLRSIVSMTRHGELAPGIHIKLDTGMHRLGFMERDIPGLISILKAAPYITVKSIFSHLTSSEDPGDDDFTHQQFERFEYMYDMICQGLGAKVSRHILNSAGISRFPEQHYNFVRIGMGLYGIDENPKVAVRLKKVHSLYARIVQIKTIPAGDSVGYNRTTIVDRETRLGVVNIGFADGLKRTLHHTDYGMLVKGMKAKILGKICMDLTMIDLTDIPGVRVGDKAIVFDDRLTIEEVCKLAGTTPYDFLSGISGRVSRVFVT